MRLSRPVTRGIAAALGVAAAIAAFAEAAAQDRPARPEGPSPRAERFIRLYDTGGDGKVSVAEITAEQKRLFGAVDLDGNGTLSVAEFRRRGRLFQTLGTTTLFDLLDANGDRKISASELSSPSKRWFARYDANNDGAMTAGELPDHRWRRFRRRMHRR